MKLAHLAALACGLALLLGACSSNNASGTTTGGSAGPDTDTGTDGGGNGGGADGTGDGMDDGKSAEQLAAETAVMRALALTSANASAFADARTELAAWVTAAEDALEAANADSENPAAIGAAARMLAAAREYQAAQTTALDNKEASFAWYGREMVRHSFAHGEAVRPAATRAMVDRTDRGEEDSLGGEDSNTNPFTARKYSSENPKKVFSGAGDEFEVQGYVVPHDGKANWDPNVISGLRLTNTGLVMRTGHVQGTRDFDNDGTADFPLPDNGVYTDMKVKVDAAVALDLALQDLEITFVEPQSAPVGDKYTSWTGNGDFYWRSIVPLDKTQEPGGTNAAATNFHNIPAGYRSLGTYELWLSNHIGVETNLEPEAGETAVCPVSGERKSSCPEDDVNLYLDYAAYGLFAYVEAADFLTAGADEAARSGARAGRGGRISSMHFGYEAFGTGDDERTTDIDTAITSGTFRGETIAYAFRGDADSDAGITDSMLLRGDVSLTVSIPKTTGTGTLEGELTNFEEWFDGRVWRSYNLEVTLNDGTADADPVDIGTDGSFAGVATASPTTNLDNSGAGRFYGNFYGPRTSTGLEAAGSWQIGIDDQPGTATDYYVVGSFGAKQRQQ